MRDSKMKNDGKRRTTLVHRHLYTYASLALPINRVWPFYCQPLCQPLAIMMTLSSAAAGTPRVPLPCRFVPATPEKRHRGYSVTSQQRWNFGMDALYLYQLLNLYYGQYVKNGWSIFGDYVKIVLDITSVANYLCTRISNVKPAPKSPIHRSASIFCRFPSIAKNFKALSTASARPPEPTHLPIYRYALARE